MLYRPSDERDLSNFDISMESIASQDNLPVRENVPFEGSENIGYDLYELENRMYGSFEPSPISKGGTPRMFHGVEPEVSPSQDSASFDSQDSPPSGRLDEKGER